MHLKSYYRDILITAGLTSLIGEVYFYPFGTEFRFTAGVIAISFLMLYFSHIPELMLIPISGVAVSAFRIFLSIVVRHTSFVTALNLHYPAFFFYLAYAVFLKTGKIKNLLNAPVNFISVMALADVGANFVELFIRHEMSLDYFQDIFTMVIGVGLLRSIITFSLYWLIERYRLLIVKEEHQKRYAELLQLVAELKAELFYIKKSTWDLEDAMKEGYEIYRILSTGSESRNSEKIGKRALNLAKDIHEIKKDYLRIISGLGELLPEENLEGMRLSAIISIIKANTERLLKMSGKNVRIHVFIESDPVVKKYFSIFSIINNLVSNALDAIENKNGFIQIKTCIDSDWVQITVEDNGKGINPKDLPYIFEPGFSTKFYEDGSISTGLGLTHVKNLVEDAGGKISVDSIEGKGTIFKVMLPATVVFDIGG
ncbi:sensor histidine kinase [Biomaibacter acetigenes]|uniref:histidine kinase n=1 Tax=Biomaibacter acetigenes TaxID=2316383 RepID=A0A3G2R3D1_9FIRM|nr:sensor histidine kinase [Biomaibacter acetigenes]AYO29902.1 sensor histidine kinase [Biomaibacter acetigenes]